MNPRWHRRGFVVCGRYDGGMDDELLAFLRSMADHPDDAVTPLVFADWLDERGDPRAKYVRLCQDWMHADRVVAADPSPAALDECYLAMTKAKAAFLPFLNAVLRPCLQQRAGVTTAYSFVEGLAAPPEKLARISDPSLTSCVSRIALSFWPKRRVPHALFDLSLPLLHTVEIAPADWGRVPDDSAEAFLDIIRWLDRPELAHIQNIELHTPSGRGLGGMWAWLQAFEPPHSWASKTIRLVPPAYYRDRQMTEDTLIAEYEAFAACPLARLAARAGVEALDPRRLVRRPHPLPLPSVVAPRDFFRCTNQYRTWVSLAERSSATTRAVERAVRRRPPADNPPGGYEAEDQGRPVDHRNWQRNARRK